MAIAAPKPKIYTAEEYFAVEIALADLYEAIEFE